MLKSLTSPRGLFALSLLLMCAVVPFIAASMENTYWPAVFMRAMVWSIAAISLNLILGYGGMVSFGHAMFLGLGAYSVGILAYYDINNAWLQLLATVGSCALIGLVFGAISLRTRAVYFIMITMALSQMLYYLVISVEEYGSDDGLVIYNRSDFGLSFFSLDSENTLYYSIFVLMLVCLWLVWRIVNSRFGMVLQGAAMNEQRMEALGFPVFRYRLAGFMIAGIMCGLAGFMSANIETFTSPDILHWTRSGELIFMVVLGGMGSLFGPVAGALVFWLLSEFLPQLPEIGGFAIGEHWHLIFGPFLLLVILFARDGIDGLFTNRRKDP